MSNRTQEMEAFRRVAEEKLKNHLSELNTRYWYEGQERVSDETRRQAFQEHRRILEKELDDQVQAVLNNSGDDQLKADLENAKQEYLDKMAPGREDR